MDDALHRQLCKLSTALFQASKSTLVNRTSAHVCSTAVSFIQLEKAAVAFESATSAFAGRYGVFFGSLAGDLVMSVVLMTGESKPPPPPKKKKRGRDEAADRANDAVEAARRRLKKLGKPIDEVGLENAACQMTRLFNLKGAHHDEVVVDTLGLSISASHAVPRLIVAARMAAGVAVDAKLLAGAIRGEAATPPDGLLTTSRANIDSRFLLPDDEIRASDERKHVLLYSSTEI